MVVAKRRSAIVFVDGNNWYHSKNFVFRGGLVASLFGIRALRCSEVFGKYGEFLR